MLICPNKPRTGAARGKHTLASSWGGRKGRQLTYQSSLFGQFQVSERLFKKKKEEEGRKAKGGGGRAKKKGFLSA